MTENEIKEKDKNIIDVAKQHDIFWTAADCYAIEKHLAFTIGRLSEINQEEAKQLLPVYEEVRKIRTKLLARLAPRGTRYDLWCIFKHFLGAVIEATEVGIKDKSEGDMENALKMFEISNDLYDIFWLIVNYIEQKNKRECNVP